MPWWLPSVAPAQPIMFHAHKVRQTPLGSEQGAARCGRL